MHEPVLELRDAFIAILSPTRWICDGSIQELLLRLYG